MYYNPKVFYQNTLDYFHGIKYNLNKIGKKL